MVKFSLPQKAFATVVLVSVTALMGSAASATPLPSSDLAQGSVCADIADLAIANEGVSVVPSTTASYGCIGDLVVVTVNEGTAQEQSFQRELQFADDEPLEQSMSDVTEPLVVPYESGGALSALAATCSYSNFDRAIVSELQDLISGCLVYGQYNPQTGVSIWERNITYEWNMYTGWNSPSNNFRTIASNGTPVMSGVFSTYKQNGILPPIWKSSAAFSNTGNQTTNGYLSGSTTTGGKYHVKMQNIRVKDSQKSFDTIFDGGVSSHRFECNSGTKRCYFPNGQEAGV